MPLATKTQPLMNGKVSKLSRLLIKCLTLVNSFTTNHSNGRSWFKFDHVITYQKGSISMMLRPIKLKNETQ